MKTAVTVSRLHDAHASSGHVERPERIHAIERVLEEGQTLRDALRLPPAPAPVEAALLAHPAEYLERLQAACEAGGARLDPDTYATPASWDVAMEALGALLATCDAVMDGRADNGFAIVRPPGHHARPDEAMGFCLLGNAAIAARWLQRQHGVERVLVLDFDVHHGNGTQEILYEDPSVLYMSLHQWPLYPGTGRNDERGAGAGLGATVNVPLPARTGDAGYLAAFDRILTPLALRFKPEVILVSAGYDAHWRDPIAGMHVTVNGFARMMREALAWADATAEGRLVALLEGGYDAMALAYSVRASLDVLRDPDAAVEDPFGTPQIVDADATRHLDAAAAAHLLP
ncbi:MAG: histone deacetylase [Rhodothermales bacterium]